MLGLNQRSNTTNAINNPRGTLTRQIVKRRMTQLPVDVAPLNNGVTPPPFATPPPVQPTLTPQPVVPPVAADANKQLQLQRLAQLRRSIGI